MMQHSSTNNHHPPSPLTDDERQLIQLYRQYLDTVDDARSEQTALLAFREDARRGNVSVTISADGNPPVELSRLLASSVTHSAIENCSYRVSGALTAFVDAIHDMAMQAGGIGEGGESC